MLPEVVWANVSLEHDVQVATTANGRCPRSVTELPKRRARAPRADCCSKRLLPEVVWANVSLERNVQTATTAKGPRPPRSATELPKRRPRNRADRYEEQLRHSAS